MKRLSLSQGKFALVYDRDFKWLSQWKWSASRMVSTAGVEYFYACRSEMRDGKPTKIYLHRAIMGDPKGKIVDHHNRDTLDCRRSNLRVCTQKQNTLNKVGSRARVTSQYKGVWRRKNGGSWCAQFRSKKLGSFHNEEEAALAYDNAAKAYSPEYCLTNNL